MRSLHLLKRSGIVPGAYKFQFLKSVILNYFLILVMTYKNKKCSDIAEGMISSLVEDMPYQKGDEVSVIVNGTGRTTMMELMIFYTAVEKYLTKKGIRIFKPLVGSFITTQEMGGIGLAVCKMDEEMKEAWTADTKAPQFPNFS